MELNRNYFAAYAAEEILDAFDSVEGLTLTDASEMLDGFNYDGDIFEFRTKHGIGTIMSNGYGVISLLDIIEVLLPNGDSFFTYLSDAAQG
jgi:hypothetical protein